MKDARSRLILALDLPDRQTAMAALDRIAGHVGYIKVGLELFVREGPPLVEEIHHRGERVFLDLKLHDIPNTVAGAVRAACKLDIEMLTVHAAGGRAMLEAARDAAGSSISPPLLLAVTALTSLSQEAIWDIGIQGPLSGWVEMLANLAHQSGIPGLVASSSELPLLRRNLSTAMKYVIPGIRPPGIPSQDQARTATPSEAIRMGADFLVVGRPILRAEDPAGAADAIVSEIETAILNH